jgi:uncharacterized protein YaaN involved in tellurite resistance
MNQDLMRLINELMNTLNSLEQHIAAGDAKGQRLIHEACEQLTKISKKAEQES